MKNYFLVIWCLVAFFSCKKTEINPKDQQTDLLSAKKWKVVKYTNQSVSFNGYTYEYKKDGTLITNNVNTNSASVRYWKWLDDGKSFVVYGADGKTLVNTSYILELNDKQFVYYFTEPNSTTRVDVTAEPYTN